MQIRYLARRNIAPNYSLGVEYTQTLSITSHSLETRSQDTTSVSLSGNTQSYVFRLEDVHSVTTGVYDASTTEYASVLQCVRSISAKEHFFIDLHDGLGFQNAILEQPAKLSRHSLANEWRFDLVIRILP